MTFKTNLLPGTDNTWELGSSSLGWKITKINIPTTSGGTTYGSGSAGQVLTSNGTTIYWANGYSLPLAANGTRGGIQIGYSESGNNYAVKLSSEKAYVTVPWTDTKVTQNNTTVANDYRVLLSASANDTAETNTINKNTNLRYNPSTNTLSTGNITGTGNLNITGNANLNGETYAASITAGSLLVNGNTNFVQIPTAPTPAATSNDTSVATTAFVTSALTGVSSPMRFIGSLGTGGTATSLAAASTSNQGYTYKVITANTYQGVAAKVGDMLVSNGSSWILIPSGDEPSGTVTSITLKAGNGITLDTDNSAITTSGTRTISHKDTSSVSNLTANGRTYVTGLTFDTYGHVTAYTTGTETVTNSDTKNTAGSTDTTSKIFLIGATSQAANPQTYSDSEIYVQNGTLYAVKAQDLSGTANNKPALIVGGADTSAHMELDSNEIQAKTNGTSVAQLYINNDGGLVTIGSGGLAITSLTASQAVSTDANKKLVSTNLTVSDPTASGTGITYIATISQSATGKITATKSTVRSASTSQTGVVKLNSATNSTDETLAATPKAVKTAYDLANTANTTANNHKYWASLEATSAASYNATPEMATLKLNGNTSATAASTSNVTLVYDSTNQALNFVFA